MGSPPVECKPEELGRTNVLRGDASNKADLVLGRVSVTVTKSLGNPNATGSIYLVSIYFKLSSPGWEARMPGAAKRGANEGMGGGPRGIKRPTAMMDAVIQIEIDVVGSVLLTPCLESILKDLPIGGKIPAKDMADDVFLSAMLLYSMSGRGGSATRQLK